MVMTSAHGISAQSAAAPLNDQAAESIREHVDEAEDLVENLLEWRHVLTAAGRDTRDALPTSPASTLISVERSEIQRLSELLSAAAAVLPGTGQPAPSRPRGDLRAHLEKAQEIARELLPDAPSAPVGTSGGRGDLIEVDRAALQRLEVEIGAIDLVAPRRLKQR
jgi:hypothetical protein